MRRILALALFLAAVVSAAAAQTTSTGTTSTGKDSALVEASKKSTRRGKKPTNVITNATLKQSGRKAHVTTTRSQPPVPQIPATVIPEKGKVIEVAPGKSAVAAAPAPAPLPVAIDEADDPLSEMDPAQAERAAAEAARRAEEAQKKPPQD